MGYVWGVMIVGRGVTIDESPPSPEVLEGEREVVHTGS